MKHNTKVILIILVMFVISQLIGIYVVSHYVSNDLPLGFEIPEPQDQGDYNQSLISLVIAFVIAVFLMLLLSKFKIELILRIWFFAVLVIALTVSMNAFIISFPFRFILIFLISITLAYLTIFQRNYIMNNIVYMLVYPGIAAVFVQFLNIFTLVVLLLLISAYDIWAVWHVGIMQKMAKYQINKLNIFSGFYVPYMTKKLKLKLQKMKKSDLRKKKIRVNVAMLGGGDVAFSMIAVGVAFSTFGLTSALLVVLGSTAGLTYLLLSSEKKKFYPAMPFISAGILVAILLSYLLW